MLLLTPSRRLVVIALAIVYVAWGATYLGIRVAIETIPPLLMAGTRFALAGFILFSFIRLFVPNQFVWGNKKEWRDASISGILLILGGNGCVTLAERSVPSGVAALTIALVPMWLLLFDWIRPQGVAPTRNAVIGLIMGLAGVVFLVNGTSMELSVQNRYAFTLLFIAGLCWSLGALYSRYVTSEGSPLLPIARQMMVGGFVMFLASLIHGEGALFHGDQLSTRSIIAFLYLLIFGSLLGYSAYVWLMKVTTPTLVGTTAYVNPAIAVILGVTLGEEILSRSQIIGGIFVLCAVVVVSFSKKQ